jgi:hypothetical protein
MKNLTLAIIAIFTLSLSFTSYAQQALTKELITSFQSVTKQWEVVESKYPQIFAAIEDIDMSKQDEIIGYIKSSKAYPEMKAILEKSGFKSLDDFYNVTMRLMGGMMSTQMENMPEGMTLDSATTMLEQSIKQMKERNVPQSMIDGLEKQYKEHKSQLDSMKMAMKQASPADKKFVKENIDWLTSMFEHEM